MNGGRLVAAPAQAVPFLDKHLRPAAGAMARIGRPPSVSLSARASVAADV